jgi:ankyrin repeat protein
MALVTLPAELIRLIVETVEIIDEDSPTSDDEDDDSESESYDNSEDNEGGPEITPLDPEIRLADPTPNGQRLRRTLNTKDLNALAQSCRRLGFVVNSLLYEANREFQASSAVYWAAAAGRTETLARVMELGLSIDEEMGVDVLFRLDEDYVWRPVQVALEFDEHETMKWLLDHGAALDLPVTSTLPEQEDSVEAADEGWSLLCQALRQGKEDLSLNLIRRGSRLFFADVGGPVTNSALHVAAGASLEGVVAVLLQEYGMNSTLALGMPWPSTPLNNAAASSNGVAIIDALLRHGVDVNADGSQAFGTPAYEERIRDQFSPLKTALRQRQWSNARTLLERGARIDSKITTYFYEYCPDGSEEGLRVLDVLIRDHGVDINAPDPENGRTAFGETACWYGDEALIKFMLENGADPNKPNGDDGDIPLCIVRMKTGYDVHARLVGLLLDHGADPDRHINKEREETWLETVRDCPDTEELKELLEVLPGRGLDIPWKELKARASGPRYSTRAVPWRDLRRLV